MILILAGRWRMGVTIALFIVILIGMFSAVMNTLGQPPLPSSVLMKSDITAHLYNGDWLAAFLELMQSLFASITRSVFGVVVGITLLILLLSIVVNIVRERSLRLDSHLFKIVLIVGLGGHLAAGKYGWFNRYEVYAVVILVIGCVYLLPPVLQAFSRRVRIFSQFCLLSFCLLSGYLTWPRR